MNDETKKIRDEMAHEYWNSINTEYPVQLHATSVFKAGFDAAMERTKILEEALEWISEDFPMSHTNNVVSKAKSALEKFRGEK